MLYAEIKSPKQAWVRTNLWASDRKMSESLLGLKELKGSEQQWSQMMDTRLPSAVQMQKVTEGMEFAWV